MVKTFMKFCEFRVGGVAFTNKFSISRDIGMIWSLEIHISPNSKMVKFYHCNKSNSY